MKKFSGFRSGTKFFEPVFLSIMLILALFATSSFRSAYTKTVQTSTPVEMEAADQGSEPPTEVLTATTPDPGVEGAVSGRINAVVVRSWNPCSSGMLPWVDLNANWTSYGPVPIHITYNNPVLCKGTITYANLVASGADVVILQNPSGSPQQYSASEVAALKQYAQAGHNLIGTYMTFRWTTCNNTLLAPLFGLVGSISFQKTGKYVVETYTVLEAANLLFTGIGSSYASGGYDQSQVPTDGIWGSEDLHGARFVAKTTDNAAAITVYDQGQYHAIFISTMPEYQGNAADERFLYNAITYTARTLPSIPTLVAPANNALSPTYKPTLDWNNSSTPIGYPGFSHYQLQVATNSGFTGALVKTLNGVSNSQFTFGNSLAPNTKYYWRVRSFNTAGKSSNWSAVWTFRTRIAPPSLVSPANGAHGGSRKPTFTWNAPAGATSYTIQIAKDPGFIGLVDSVDVSATHYTPSANLPIDNLYWHVLAKGANGPSDYSTGRKVIIP